MKETGSVSVIETLVQQQAPANFVKRLAVCGLRCKPELVIGAAPLFKTPESFGPEVRIGTARKSCEARHSFGVMPMLALHPAVAGNSGACHKLTHQQECRKKGDAPHWSSFSCTFDSSTRASVNCFL